MNKRKDGINIGDRIEIIKITTKGERTYPSQILDITNEGNFLISGPIWQNQIIPIHKGEKIKISYVVKNKGRYAFDALVIRREYKNIYILEIQKISNIKKYQMRRYYRFNISIPVIKEFVLKIKAEEEILIEECKTKDISGSGFRLYSNYKHDVGDIVRCKFNIEENPIGIKGKVVRIEKVDTFDYKYSLGIDFIDISEQNRDIIIKFIFKQERILIEKGLI